MKRQAIMVLVTSAALRSARADQGELSLHADLAPVIMSGAGYGSARNDEAKSSSGTGIGGRLGARMTYGITDAFALEVGAGALLVPKLRIDNQPLPPPSSARANEDQTDLAFRGTVGATLRLGTEIIPTLTVLAGYQHRIISGVEYRDVVRGTAITPPGLGSASTDELLVGIGLGLDVRLSATWVVGISFQFVHGFSSNGQSYNAVEAPLSVGGFWYPRGASPEFLPGGKPLDVD